MGRNIDNKCKQCRRIGEKLFLKGDRCFTAKCAMVKRNYVPGFHGPKGAAFNGWFTVQEKQKAKKYRLIRKAIVNLLVQTFIRGNYKLEKCV